MLSFVWILVIFMGLNSRVTCLAYNRPKGLFKIHPLKPEIASEDGADNLNDILKDIETQKMAEKTLYNGTEPIKMCWVNVLYVNESGKEATPWQEYRFEVYSPSEDPPKKNHSKEYRQYGVQMGGDEVKPQDFEVIESNSRYTISKHENFSCGEGQYVAKTFYADSETNQKRIIIRLIDELTEDHINFNFDESGLEMDQNSAMTIVEDSTSTESILKLTDVPVLGSKLNEEFINASSNTTSNDIDYDNLDSVRSVPITSTATSTSRLPVLGPCSPLLTQLFAGNTIFPGLCNLTKDEKLVLKGDIVVSMKYLDTNNKTEILKPMLVIHENTVIENSKSEIEMVNSDEK